MTNHDRETNALQRLDDNGFDATRNDVGYTIVERVGRPEPLILQVVDLDDLEIMARVLTPR